ncbi:MAG: triple tyrosine motif-containing protein [Cyclobacteriaceae bacterium]
MPNAKGWQETQLLDTLQDYVSYIFEDKLQNVWLCGRTNAIKIETVDGAITAVEPVPFSNPTIDESVGLAFGSEVYIATGGSFHRYDLKENVFKKYDSLPGPKKYFASAGYFWFHDGHRWRTVDPRMQAALKLQWLGLFNNIRYIAPADDQSLWVITASNELFKFSGKQADQNPNVYPLFLREVRGQQDKLSPSRSVIVSQLESTVSFEFIQPDYLGMKAVEYRYQVKGQSSDWTPWATTNNIVNFSYLPAGKYKLDVQTRDLMGKISPIEEITLEVEPPYWKRPWFYLLEVIFFGSLVFLSMKLSAGNTKYRLLSQLLSMLTVIMIIQLVTATVGALVTVKASPVIDFFVQVGIALLVLPIENSLRKFMFKEKVSQQAQT